MLELFSLDSVRTHNETLHGGFANFLRTAIPLLLVFVIAWVKFAKR